MYQLLATKFEFILVTLGVVAGWWKFTDALFSWLTKRQKREQEEMIDERIDFKYANLKTEISELSKKRDSDHEILIKILAKLER